MAAAGAAADYPSKPIRFIVGFVAGGGLDISCRYWAQKLTAKTGRQIVVDNRPGAASELAVKLAMAAPADGYTLLCASASTAISSSKPNPPFDIRTDMAPVIQMTRFTFALYVNPAMPVATATELIAHAKARPGQLNYGSVGTGSTPHLAMELLKQSTGIDVVHVPFKGTAQSAAAVIGGDVQIGLDGIASLKPHFDSGRLRPVAVISAKRFPTLPNVAGMQEAGIAGVDVISWTGLVAPLKTPKPIIDLLNSWFTVILQEPDTKTFFASQGYETAGGSPQDFASQLTREVATWSKVIRAAKIRFD